MMCFLIYTANVIHICTIQSHFIQELPRAILMKHNLIIWLVWQNLCNMAKESEPQIKQANKNANYEPISTHYEGLVRKV